MRMTLFAEVASSLFGIAIVELGVPLRMHLEDVVVGLPVPY